MRHENVAVNVKSDDNGKLVIETSEGCVRTYYLAPKRTMYLHGEMLQVSMRLDSIRPGSDGLGSSLELVRQIEGTVTLKEQLVSVIGDSRSPSNKLRIVFQTVTSDGREKHEGSEQKGSAVPSYTRAWIKCIRLNQGFGEGPAWFAVCMVSPATLDAIASAVTTQTLNALTVGMMFNNIYIDDDNEEHWMDDPRPVKEWYLRPAIEDNTIGFPEDAYGAVTYLDLAFGTVALSQQPGVKTASGAPVDTTPPLAEAQPDYHTTALNLIAGNIDEFRSAVTWIGGAITLVLFILVFKSS